MLEQSLEAVSRIDVRRQMNKCKTIFIDYFGDVQVCASQNTAQTDSIGAINVSNNLAFVVRLVKHFLKARPVRY